MKDPRFRGLHLVTYLDDASRCIVAARFFENAVLVLCDAISQFGIPATTLSDNGKCFVGAHSSKKKNLPKGRWTPTAFESELINHGISLINSCSQTNGKLERFHRSIDVVLYEPLGILQ